MSPTLLETLRACPLRACFRNSSPAIYPGRHSPAAGLGIAFHQTLEYLSRYQLATNDPAELAEHILLFFRDRLTQQGQAGLDYPRRTAVEVAHDRIQRAEHALILLARAVAIEKSEERRGAPRARVTDVELRLITHDGLIAGVLDRVERCKDGVRIIDYKTAIVMRDEDHDRYCRQLKLYAYLWFENFGTWPKEAVLSYVMLRRDLTVQLDPSECIILAEEARALAEEIQAKPSDYEALANVGAACRFCDYRPWCKPFWKRQTAVSDQDFLATAGLGFQGSIVSVRRSGPVALIELQTPGRTIDFRLLCERFGYLESVAQGEGLRVLDAQVTGPVSRPNAEATDRTEAFLVKGHL